MSTITSLNQKYLGQGHLAIPLLSVSRHECTTSRCTEGQCKQHTLALGYVQIKKNLDVQKLIAHQSLFCNVHEKGSTLLYYSIETSVYPGIEEDSVAL